MIIILSIVSENPYKNANIETDYHSSTSPISIVNMSFPRTDYLQVTKSYVKHDEPGDYFAKSEKIASTLEERVVCVLAFIYGPRTMSKLGFKTRYITVGVKSRN